MIGELSYNEASKIINVKIYILHEYWLLDLYNVNKEDFIKLLNTWKNKNPSKKILDDFKKLLDFKIVDDGFYLSHYIFYRQPQNLLDLVIIDNLKRNNLQIIELLIYFNVDINSSLDIIENLNYIIISYILINNINNNKINKKNIKYIKEDYDYFNDYIKDYYTKPNYNLEDYFLKDEVYLIEFNTIFNLFKEEEKLINLLNEWKINPPPKKILDIFKNILNFKYNHYDGGVPNCYLINIVIKGIIDLNYMYDYVSFEKTSNCYKLLELFIFFGANINKKSLKILKKPYKKSKEMIDLFNKVINGKKIVKFIKYNLNDEIEMKPLRTKLYN